MLGPFLNTIPDGWPFNDLERLLQAAAADPAARAEFWRALLESTVFVLGGAEGASNGRATLQPGQALKVRGITLPTGPALAAFTSKEILSCSIAEHTSFVALPFRALVETTQNARIALNPCGPYGKELTPEEIKMGLGGVISRGDGKLEVTRQTKALIGRMAREPEDLIEAIVQACKSEPLITGAFLANIYVPETGEAPHPLVALETQDFARAAPIVANATDGWSQRSKLPVDVVDSAVKGLLGSGGKKFGRRVYRKGGWLSGLFG